VFYRRSDTSGARGAAVAARPFSDWRFPRILSTSAFRVISRETPDRIDFAGRFIAEATLPVLAVLLGLKLTPNSVEGTSREITRNPRQD
jgi:hypothetical protein